MNLGANYRFIFSGANINEEVKSYKILIQKLGGLFLDCSKDQFIHSCTHIICFHLKSSVSIMGGLASGKWLIDKKYLDDSYKQKKFLNEEDYEVDYFNYVSRHCRKLGSPLYEGMIFYLDVKDNSKLLKRILLAGGATVLDLQEVIIDKRKMHAAICDDSTYFSVKNTISDDRIPIVNSNYIQETIFKRHSRYEYKKFLMDKSQRIITPGISNFKNNIEIRNEIIPKIRATPRVIKKTNARRPTYSGSIEQYLIKKNGTSCVSTLENSLIKKPKIDDYSEVEIIGEYVKSERIQIKESSKLEKVSDTMFPFTEAKKSHPEVIQLIDEDNSSEKLVSDLTTCNISNYLSCQVVDSSTNYHKVCEEATNDSEVISLKANTFLNKEEESMLLDTEKKNLSFESENTIKESKSAVLTEKAMNGTVGTPLLVTNTIEPETKKVEVISNVNEKEISLQNKAAIFKAGQHTVQYDLNTLRATLSQFLIKINTSYFMLCLNFIFIPKHMPYIIKNFSDNSPTKLVIKPIELKSNDTILHNTLFDDQNMDICSQKVGRCTIKVAKQIEKVSFDEEDALVALCYLQWLQCQIRRDCYPSFQVVGDMIKIHILKFPFQKVKYKALNIFGEFISLHPPHVQKLRTFYINVFSHASSDKVLPGNNRAWGFIKYIIEEVLVDSSLSRTSEAKIDPCLTVLENVIHILEQDLIYYNFSPVNVQKLICYQLFWPLKNDNPSVVSKTIREFINLWIKSLQSNAIVRRLLTRLLCIILEMLWKWSELNNPILLTNWPLPNNWMPLINEILIKFRGLEDVTPTLELLQFVEIPWQRMLLSSLAYRAVDPIESTTFIITLSNLKSSVKRNIKKCTEEPNTSASGSLTPHSTIMELLAIMTLSFVDSSGQRFCKQAFSQQFKESLKKKDFIESSIRACSNDIENLDGFNYEEYAGCGNLKRKYSDVSQIGISSQVNNNDSSFVNETATKTNDFVSPEMLDEMLIVFQKLPSYLKSFNIYGEKCPHLVKSGLLEKF